MPDRRVTEVLHVEDDPVDVRIFARAARDAGFDMPIATVGSGDAALAHLRDARRRTGRNNTLVLTDINMPGLSGHELMEDVRRDADLRSTVFFVLSSSDQTKDLEQAYDNGAAGYIVKQSSESAMRTCAQMLKAYCSVVEVP